VGEPMTLLQRIQELQFDDPKEAEQLLLTFIRERFPDLNAQAVELRPQVISLNSFNGFLTLQDGRRLFFKTHTEEDNVIGEYYNAQMLADAGYPVIQPLHSSTQAGQHLLIYDLIEDPSVFDVAWQIEQGEAEDLAAPLGMAQNKADRHLLEYYKRTLFPQTGQDAAEAPIHQLFYHRLQGGRFERFYGALPGNRGKRLYIKLPGNRSFSIYKVRKAQWVINGQRYDESLDDLVTSALELLDPAQPGSSIIGHGDAHNGNVFFQHDDKAEPSLLYFDPAFAGRHNPLLDLVKPLFHNVFAMWMYYPQIKHDALEISMRYTRRTFHVDHNYTLPPIREMFLFSKVDRVLIPILQELRARGELRLDWRRYLKAALMCCPLLTLNLADNDRFTPEISLLGLTMVMEMGAESQGERSLIDRTLDRVARVLAMDTAAPSDRWYG